MPQPLRIGLTGGIASGKSTVTQRFSELGAPIVDADVASRAVVGKGTAGLQLIVNRFGPEILGPDGGLNRATLRARIFRDPGMRKELERMLHPLIRSYMEEEAKSAIFPYVIMAIPLLIESGSPRNRVDRILVIDVEETTQLRRLIARDGGTEDEARSILASQATRESRMAAADDVLKNDGSVTDLRQAVDRLHTIYLSLANLL